MSHRAVDSTDSVRPASTDAGRLDAMPEEHEAVAGFGRYGPRAVGEDRVTYHEHRVSAASLTGPDGPGTLDAFDGRDLGEDLRDLGDPFRNLKTRGRGDSEEEVAAARRIERVVGSS